MRDNPETGLTAGHIDALLDRAPAALLVVGNPQQDSVPAQLRQSAERCGVGLVALPGRASAAALLVHLELALTRAEAARLGELERFTNLLLDELRTGSGLSGLMEVTSAVVEGPVVLVTAGRRIVAVAGLHEAADASAALAAITTSVPVTIRGRPWGGLSTAASGHAGEVSVEALMLRTAAVVELELLRSSEALAPEHRARRELMTELLTGRGTGRIVQRAELLGVSIAPGDELVALAVDRAALTNGVVEQALARHAVAALWSALDEDVLVLGVVPVGMTAAEVGERLASTLVRSSPAAVGPLVALGPAADGIVQAGRALREARRTLSIARVTGDRRLIVTAGMLIVDRLLARAAEDAEVVQTIEEVLAPLRSIRPARARTLLETLRVYLDCGASKTDASLSLGIRRQSLYSRLGQLDDLVGPLSDPERRLALHIALRATRVSGVLGLAPHDESASRGG